MKKQDTLSIKRVINSDKRYSTYYQSKTEELRVEVYRYYENYDKEVEKNQILKVLNKLSESGLRPRYKIDKKTYQGFIHITYVIFY